MLARYLHETRMKQQRNLFMVQINGRISDLFYYLLFKGPPLLSYGDGGMYRYFKTINATDFDDEK